MKAANKVLAVTGGSKGAYRVMVTGDAKLIDGLYRLSPSRAAAFIAGR